MIGQCYELGRGVDKSASEAEHWYALAAEQGHEEAQKRLGFFSKLGRIFGL